MNDATSEVTVRSRVKPQIKEMAEEILKNLGLSMSGAIKIYLQQIVHQGCLPFDLKLPSKDTIKAINEDVSKSKRYSCTSEMWKDLGIDPATSA